MRKSARHTFRPALVAALALAFAPAAQAQLTAAAQARESGIVAQYPPPGRMVDVGGRRLHIQCKGPERGPTVVFEAGAVASAVYYWKAQDEVAKIVHVCVYDRAGLGWSDPAPYPRSLEARADDLHTLIRKAHIHRPVILVGHSMGGLIVQIYAKKHPRDIAGLVLMEPSSVAFNGTPESVARVGGAVRQMGLAISAANLGMEVAQLKVPNGPPEQAIALRAGVFRAGQDDMAAMEGLPQEVQRLGGLGSLGRTPLVVVSRGKRDPGQPEADHAAWLAAHAGLATLSTRSARLTAAQSGHNVPYDQPAMFREAVEKVLELARTR